VAEIQLSMVGVIVSEMPRALEFYRRLGLDIPVEDDGGSFVMHRMGSGVTIFFDTVFFAGADRDRKASLRGSYNLSLEFYLETREAVDAKYAELTGYGYSGRREPVKSPGPYIAIVEDPDGNVILLSAEDANAEIRPR
jgi:catechol 2,3-dioxygenase-like lactoylglutathione lyase family enzyme